MTSRQRLHYLGAQIAYWRERRGLRQEDLAQTVGISRSTVMRIEQGGGCNVKILFALADELKVSPAVLIERMEL